MIKFIDKLTDMRLVLWLCLIALVYSYSMTSVKPMKINGVSFVASSDSIQSKHIAPVVGVNANYASVMPFGFIENLHDPQVNFNRDWQWYGEKKEGVKQYIEALQEQQIKIMLKPQLWVSKGEFTGGIEMYTEDDWRILEQSYSKFILEFAELAEATHSDIFCIGTELETFITHRPAFWSNLIVEVKKRYSGKLTYAANWNEFNKTPFWDQLDYIGVDAYFPVSDGKTPSVADCLEGWKQHEIQIVEYSKKYQKPVLFTEFGYRSVDYAGKQPWRSDRDMTSVNLEAQTNATQALFETFWDKEWFAGGFIWKWFHNHHEVGGESNSRFTPQNKPVEQLIKKQYGLY